MKKYLLTLFGFLLTSTPLLAKDNLATGETLNACWQCNILEGIYIYLFNFVYKLYDIFVPIVRNLLWLSLAFWFIWYVWTNVIKEPKGTVYDMGKDIVGKLFMYTFVLGMLSLPATEIFRYTINPIINAGTGLSKWILVETENNAEILQQGNVKSFNCDNIELRVSNELYKNTETHPNELSSVNQDTLRNLLCITREFSRTQELGLELGFNIMAKSAIGIAEVKLIDFIYKNPKVQALETAIKIAMQGFSIIYSIIMIFVKLWFAIAFILNIFTFIIGLAISVGFLYILFSYLLILLDIIVKLAIVGLMMPITIGSFLFDYTRGKFSGPLFFNVVECAFRIVFLAISISISTFLLNELMTSTFVSGDVDFTLRSLLEAVKGNGKVFTASTYIDGVNIISDSKWIILQTFIANPAIIISMIFVCLLSFTLISESNNLAKKFSSTIGQGIDDDTVLNGLKQITFTTINYIKTGVTREIEGYTKADAVKKALDSNKGVKARKPGEPLTVHDIPLEDVIRIYQEQKNSSGDNNETENILSESAQAEQSNGDNSLNEDTASKGTSTDTSTNLDIIRYTETSTEEKNIIDGELQSDTDYSNLTPEQKDLIQSTILYGESPKRIAEVAKDKKVQAIYAKIKDDKTGKISSIKDTVDKSIIIKKIDDSENIKSQRKEDLKNIIENNKQESSDDEAILNGIFDDIQTERKFAGQYFESISSQSEAFKSERLKGLKEQIGIISSKDMMLVLIKYDISLIEEEMEYAYMHKNFFQHVYFKIKLKKAKENFEGIEEKTGGDEEELAYEVEKKFKKYKNRNPKRGLLSRLIKLNN